MPKLLPALSRARAPIAAAGLFTLAGTLATLHAPRDPGIAAEDITPERVAAIAAELDDSAEWKTGNLVLDLVEPDDGEGSSEDELADLVASIDALPDVEVEPAGFYSEGEHLYLVRGDAGELDALRDDPRVEGIEPELIYALPDEAVSAMEGPLDDELDPNKGGRLEVNDPMFKLQWHMEQIRAAEAWVDTRGEGVVVAVVDTGVAWKDANGVRRLPDLASTDFVAGESFIAGLPEGLDDHAHGSHVAGTIAQSTDNGIGVTGVAHRAKIMPLKVLSKDGRGSVPGIANAIRYAADHGAHVINMSLGGPLPSKVLAKAIEYAHKKGVTTVCAAGNEHRSRVGYPAANKFSVAVSATDYNRQLTFYSNWGKDIDVAAPGGDTRSDKNGDGHPDGVLQNTIRIGQPLENDYLWFQGTSMASPHGAGVAALIVASGVTNPDEVEKVMKATANHPNKVKWDEKYGAGIIDAKAAVTKAQQHYAPERASFLGLVLLAGFGGLGLAGVARRGTRALAMLGFGGALAWASGALGTTPLAYGIAGTVGAFGSPLVMSAALPLLFALVLLRVKSLRPLLVGLSFGYAALLVHGAIVLPTILDGLPGGELVDRMWLFANAVVAFALGRRIGRLDR
ncbi:MAG TPA: S8 family peptidase [Nannocystaceae bacterium]|nr:S8 family peptidase [Nannocystaceae bacterium]